MSQNKLKKEKQILRKADVFEARENKRISIQLLVDYSQKGHYLFDFCRNLGSGGIFINAEHVSPEGSELDLTFTIPDSKETLTVTGRVIWVQKLISSKPHLVPGMGIQFNVMEVEDREALDNFIERYTHKKRA